MRRRQFISLAAAAACAWPAAGFGQQPGVPVIGYLGRQTPEGFASRLAAFRRGLRETGYDEGHNVAVEYRWAAGHDERLPALAEELVRRRVNVLVAPGGVPAALAAKAATTTIPVVFEMGGDAVALGLVKSMNRPEGNVTGATSLNQDLHEKRLELLRELVPAASEFAVAINPDNPANVELKKKLDGPARDLGVKLNFFNARSDRDLDVMFTELDRLRPGGLLIAADTFFNVRSQQLAALALKHAVPAITQSPEFAVAGGLLSYAGDVGESHRQAGIYTGRILKGETPADLPVQQVTKVELTINLKTAKALGLTVSLPLLGRADQVIE